VWVEERPIGYVDAGQAAHLQTAFEVSPEPVVVPVRRSRRKQSPLFDIYLPNLHPDEESQCDVCKSRAANSRDWMYGPLDPAKTAPAAVWTRDGWKPV